MYLSFTYMIQVFLGLRNYENTNDSRKMFAVRLIIHFYLFIYLFIYL